MAEVNSGNKKIFKNTIFLGIRMVIVLGISLYTSRVVLQVLGVEDYGIYNVVGGFVVMFGFFNNAMTTGIQRFFNFELGKNGVEGANKVFITAVYTQVIIALIVATLLESIGLWYLYDKMVLPPSRLHAAFWIFQFSTLVMIIGILKIPFSAAIVAHERLDYYAFLSVLDTFLKLIIALILSYIPADKLVLYGLLMLGISLFDFSLNMLYAYKNFSEIRFRFILYKELLTNMLTFSGWNVFGKLSVMLKDQGLNMILNLFFGPVINAARGVAFQVTGALNGFVSNVNMAVKPQLTQSFAKGNISRTFSLMFSISKLNFFILFIMSLPVCLEIDFVLKIWLGSNVPQYTGIFIIIVILSSLRATLSTQVSYVVQATGIMKKYQLITSVIELSMLPIAYLCLKFGANPPSVFIVSFFVCLVSLIVGLFILRGIVHISLKSYTEIVVLPLLLSSIIALLIPLGCRLLLPVSWARLFVVFLLSIISTVISFFFLGTTQTEKKMIYSITNNLTNKLFHKN